MIHRNSFRVHISEIPPDAADVVRALLGMTVEEFTAEILEDRDGRYSDLYKSDRESA